MDSDFFDINSDDVIEHLSNTLSQFEDVVKEAEQPEFSDSQESSSSSDSDNNSAGPVEYQPSSEMNYASDSVASNPYDEIFAHHTDAILDEPEQENSAEPEPEYTASDRSDSEEYETPSPDPPSTAPLPDVVPRSRLATTMAVSDLDESYVITDESDDGFSVPPDPISDRSMVGLICGLMVEAFFLQSVLHLPANDLRDELDMEGVPVPDFDIAAFTADQVTDSMLESDVILLPDHIHTLYTAVNRLREQLDIHRHDLERRQMDNAVDDLRFGRQLASEPIATQLLKDLARATVVEFTSVCSWEASYDRPLLLPAPHNAMADEYADDEADRARVLVLLRPILEQAAKEQQDLSQWVEDTLLSMSRGGGLDPSATDPLPLAVDTTAVDRAHSAVAVDMDAVHDALRTLADEYEVKLKDAGLLDKNAEIEGLAAEPETIEDILAQHLQDLTLETPQVPVPTFGLPSETALEICFLGQAPPSSYDAEPVRASKFQTPNTLKAMEQRRLNRMVLQSMRGRHVKNDPLYSTRPADYATPYVGTGIYNKDLFYFPPAVACEDPDDTRALIAAVNTAHGVDLGLGREEAPEDTAREEDAIAQREAEVQQRTTRLWAAVGGRTPFVQRRTQSSLAIMGPKAAASLRRSKMAETKHSLRLHVGLSAEREARDAVSEVVSMSSKRTRSAMSISRSARTHLDPRAEAMLTIVEKRKQIQREKARRLLQKEREQGRASSPREHSSASSRSYVPFQKSGKTVLAAIRRQAALRQEDTTAGTHALVRGHSGLVRQSQSNQHVRIHEPTPDLQFQYVRPPWFGADKGHRFAGEAAETYNVILGADTAYVRQPRANERDFLESYDFTEEERLRV
ncbi:hypothetical protein J8273_6569 [Carpediemonas membranifera]|uniref:Uncharacterized protein n=1 Tax=Carpediemonas membranifera TaxID=201153 RepID=A0A8J6AT75_9EUKA|nr:hypothetical protein J8273_6569 [Carpediemonas membranifera]|eukprot:KAG9391790.1 hypothetical protein J8273_6569 [Carpediemonas membranifera]